MKKVIQLLPETQKQILVESLNLMQSALKTLNTEDEGLNYKLFDIETLKALLNKTEIVIKLPFEVYENFTQINGVDFPDYTIKTTKIIEEFFLNLIDLTGTYFLSDYVEDVKDYLSSKQSKKIIKERNKLYKIFGKNTVHGISCEVSRDFINQINKNNKFN